MENDPENTYGSLEKNKLLKKIDVISSIMVKFENSITVTCFIVMSIIVIAGVVMRYVLKIPFTWGEEAARYLMVYGIFIGISMGVKDKAHLGLELFTNMLPAKTSRCLVIISSLIGIFAYALITFLSLTLVKLMVEHGQRSPALNIPMYFIYVSLLTGFFLSLIRSVFSLIDIVLNKSCNIPRESEGT